MFRHKVFLFFIMLLVFVPTLAASGCGTVFSLLPDQGTGSVPVDPTPAAEGMTVRLYFPDLTAQLVLAEDRELVVQGISVAEAVVAALLEGPEADYLQRAFPAGSRVISVEITGRVVYVNLSEEARGQGGSAEMAALRSLVLTLTELETVDRVQLLIEGRSVVSFGEFAGPVGRDEVYDPLVSPEIVAESGRIKVFLPRGNRVKAGPAPGGTSTVMGRLELYGIAGVPDGKLIYELTLNGERVVEGSATTNQMDWGTFFESVTLPEGVYGDAVLRIYPESRGDGGPVAAVEIPLTVEKPRVVAESKQIKVYSPAPGSVVSGGFELHGVAQVYEGTVSYDLTIDGVPVLQDFTTAHDFDWGIFRKAVKLPAGKRGEAVLRLYSESAEDGSPMFIVEIPLTIQ
ncbi:MAG: GerMN domain-containing protein [Firmicutes bacterium]|nr:GerMN domain-containing protein [Bacillota bacterium]